MIRARLEVADLDRDELLALIQERCLFVLSQRDLWLARWKVLSNRATEAMRTSHAADRAFGDGVQRLVEPGLSRIEYERRRAEVDRLDQAAKRARAAEARARKADEAAYAALVACA